MSCPVQKSGWAIPLNNQISVLSWTLSNPAQAASCFEDRWLSPGPEEFIRWLLQFLGNSITTFQDIHSWPSPLLGFGGKWLQSQVTLQMPSGFFQMSTKAGITHPGCRTWSLSPHTFKKLHSPKKETPIVDLLFKATSAALIALEHLINSRGMTRCL